ncbi:MAG: hypothetical protein IJZ71_00385 [Treponema sp.]|nr:hypothetical protein [Treponema sp.]
MKEIETIFPGLKFDISYSEDEIFISLEDNGCYVNNEMEDTYFLSINYTQVFWDNFLYNEESSLSLIETFCRYVDSRIRKMLPDYEDFNKYQQIEGYWKCIGLIREICKNPLINLWNEEKQKQIEICKSILEKVSHRENSFTTDELDIIKDLAEKEVTFLKESYKD